MSMSADEILELELSLLLINYGERKVMKSLARVNGLNDNELESKLKRIHQLEKKPRSRKSVDGSKAIEAIISRHPEKSQLLNLLHSRFESRSFLPELKDVKRLFNRHSTHSTKLKSRNASAVRVFRLLASLDENELQKLTEEQDRTNYSSLGVISDEIMKRA